MSSYIGVLEGYRRRRRRHRRYGDFGRRRRRRAGRGRKSAMKACAKRYKVTSKRFHACVRRKTGGSFGRYRRRRHRR